MKRYRSTGYKIIYEIVEGDKFIKEVLNGGYNVHPVPLPYSDINENNIK